MIDKLKNSDDIYIKVEVTEQNGSELAVNIEGSMEFIFHMAVATAQIMQMFNDINYTNAVSAFASALDENLPKNTPS